MAQEATRKAKPDKAAVKIRRPKPGSKSEAILTLAATTPASNVQIADTVNSSKVLVTHVLKRYGIDRNHSDLYKQHRADVLAGMQDAILSTVNPDTINSASLMQRMAAVGILYDKERLERDLSTSNQASVMVDIAALQRIEKAGTDCK